MDSEDPGAKAPGRGLGLSRARGPEGPGAGGKLWEEPPDQPEGPHSSRLPRPNPLDIAGPHFPFSLSCEWATPPTDPRPSL